MGAHQLGEVLPIRRLHLPERFELQRMWLSVSLQIDYNIGRLRRFLVSACLIADP